MRVSGASGDARLPPSSELLGCTGDHADKMESDSMVTSSLVTTEGRDALGDRGTVQRDPATGENRARNVVLFTVFLSHRKGLIG